MPDPAERIVNLALFLAASRSPVGVDRIRLEVAGYPPDQDEATFLRMFERDKDELRAVGLVVISTPEGTYHLDASRSFCAQFTLASGEELALRAAGAALLEDPSFPFAADLRRALVKIAAATDSPVPAATRIADERASEQGMAVGALASASAMRKTVSFGYTNADGMSRGRAVEPYGLFLREGRWYLVGRDTKIDGVRVYAVPRMSDPVANTARPKTPDFEIPSDFRVSNFVGLPFQYGSGDPFDATLRFSASAAWRAEALSSGVGRFETECDGRLLWHIRARDEKALTRWTLVHGPGIDVVAPARLSDDLRASLDRLVTAHG